jgi:hypothetical protein
MLTRKFIEDAAERAILTAAEVYAAAFGVDKVTVFDANWNHISKIALTAAVISVLKSILARKRGNPEDASLVK